MSGNQIPSLPERKRASNARGMPGGMFKLRFDWYITGLAQLPGRILAVNKTRNMGHGTSSNYDNYQ